MTDTLEVGVVSGVFGVRGEVRVFLHNRDSRLFDAPRPVQLIAPDGTARSSRLVCRPGAGGRIIGRLDGVRSRQEAAAIKDWRIVVDRAVLPAPADGEFYVADVVGRPARIGPETVGTVAAVHQNGPVDIVEIARDGEEALYVPCVSAYVASAGPDGLVLTDAARGLG